MHECAIRYTKKSIRRQASVGKGTAKIVMIKMFQRKNK